MVAFWQGKKREDDSYLFFCSSSPLDRTDNNSYEDYQEVQSFSTFFLSFFLLSSSLSLIFYFDSITYFLWNVKYLCISQMFCLSCVFFLFCFLGILYEIFTFTCIHDDHIVA